VSRLKNNHLTGLDVRDPLAECADDVGVCVTISVLLLDGGDCATARRNHIVCDCSARLAMPC